MKRIVGILSLVAWVGCVEPEDRAEHDGLTTVAQAVSGALLQQRTDLIKSLAAQRGITKPLLFAAVGMAESGLAQCLSEYAGVACPGPFSSSCGGAVLAGGADGNCALQAGGLGMFQFDGGNYTQTLNLYGTGILTVSGNASAGIDTILNKVWSSSNTPFWSTWNQMLSWINSIQIPSATYEVWLDTMAIYYNGCGCSAARERYRQGAQTLLNTFGSAYWETSQPPSVPATPVGLSPSGGVISAVPTWLTWQASAGAGWYIVNTLRAVPGGWVNEAVDVTTTSASFPISAPAAATYAWKARACNNLGCSADSAWVLFSHL